MVHFSSVTQISCYKCPSPEDRDVEIVASCNMWCFDVVTEKDEGNEKIVDVRLVHRQED